jgi:hypothetical protein
MAEIFLSYANEDRETARAVADLLESSGWTVWWDRRIPAGRTWRSMIEEALRDMRCMIVLWSTHSVESDWVKEEAEEARALGNLVPVLIEPVKPPVGFRSIQAADLTGWDGAKDFLGARQLIADLEALMGKPPRRKPPDGAEAPPIKEPIPGSRVEDPAGESSANRHEGSGLAESRPGWQVDSAERESDRRPALWWQTAAAVALVVAIAGAFLWFGTRERDSAPEVAALKPPVSAPNLVGLGLSADRQEIDIDEAFHITLTGRYSDGTQKPVHEGVQWLSSEPRVATIDDRGRVTARQAGETKITARSGELVSPAWTLAVRAEKPVATAPGSTEKPVAKTPAPTQLVALTVFAPRREVKIQERLSLRAKARYSDGNEKGLAGGVEWRSSDLSIAAVDSRGELLALRPGKIAVVARWGGIESVALEIVVREAPVKPTLEPPTARPAKEPVYVSPAKPAVQGIDTSSYINRAKSHRAQGNYAAALAELEKARAVSPANQEVLDEIEATRRACNAEKRLGRGDLEC